MFPRNVTCLGASEEQNLQAWLENPLALGY